MFKNQRFNLIFSMVIFGTIGLVRRGILLPSAMVALVRGALGAGVLFLAALAGKRERDTTALKKAMPLLALSGAVIGLNWIALFEAYRYTTVSVATVCYYMQPVFVVLLSAPLLKEKLTGRKVLCVLVSLVGLVLVSGVLETGFSGLTGVLFGLAAAALYATVILINKKIQGLQPMDRTSYQLLFAALVSLPYVLLTEDLSALTWDARSVILLIVAGVFHTGFAYTLYFGAMTHLSAQTCALMSYIDPIVAVILSVVVLREALTLPAAIGVILVLGATVWGEVGGKTAKE